MVWNYDDIGSVLVAVIAHLGQFFEKFSLISLLSFNTPKCNVGFLKVSITPRFNITIKRLLIA